MKVNAWASLSVVMSLRILTSQRFFSLTTTESSDLSSVSSHCSDQFGVQDQEGKIQVYWKVLSVRLHRKGIFISNLFLMFASFYQEVFSLYPSESYKHPLQSAVVSLWGVIWRNIQYQSSIETTLLCEEWYALNTQENNFCNF